VRERPAALAVYLLWQLPGWGVAGLLLAGTVAVLGLPAWIVAAGVGLLIARDLALYPAMRAVFRRATPPHPLGVRAVAVEVLAPTGYVRVKGELWRARTADGASLPAGAHVVVRHAQGLTLVVEPADASRPS
jgi:membrane protein implicated in regulation of membrane protease activity